MFAHKSINKTRRNFGILASIVGGILALNLNTVEAQTKSSAPQVTVTQPIIIVPATPASQSKAGVAIETPTFDTSVAAASQAASSEYIPPRKLGGALWGFILLTPIVLGIYLGYQVIVYLLNRRRDWSKSRLR